LLIQLRQIGDVLLCTPALRALRKRFPHARISFLAEPLPAKVLEGNPDLDEILLRDPAGGRLEPLRTLAAVRRARFDLVIDFLANPRSTLIAMLAGAPLTISYAGGRRSRFYTHTVPVGTGYAAAQKLALLRPLGISDAPLETFMAVPAAARKKMAAWLRSVGLTRALGPVVALEPFMKHAALTYPPASWARVCEFMVREWGAAVVVCWGPGREREARELVTMSREPLLLAPATDLHELAALDGMVDLWVGVDGGPRHIAASQGTPTFAVLGPSDDAWTPPGPRHLSVAREDLSCRPCNKRFCPENHNRCLAEFSPEEVFSRLDLFWRKVKSLEQGEVQKERDQGE
jgi:ADP-heptose:LPS heptosyltransferase